VREYQSQNAERIARNNHEYKQRRSEHIREQRRQRYLANATEEREYASRYREAHREEIRQKEREQRAANLDEHRAADRARYANNPEAAKASSRKWRAANTDTVLAYYETNKERINKAQREYRQTTRGAESGRIRQQRRRARKLAAAGSFTRADIEAIRTAQGNRCYICHKPLKEYHIDHFIPLALGGTNDPGNLRLACPTCNRHKGAKHPHDMGQLI